MAQQHGRRRTGSGGSASVGRKGSSTGSSRPAGKTGGYSGRTSQGSRKSSTSGNSRAGLSIGDLAGLFSSGSSGSSSGGSTVVGSSMISGLISLLKKNKTARTIAIVLVVALVIYFVFGGGQCSGLSCGGGADYSNYSSFFGGYDSLVNIAGTTSGEHSADMSVSNEARSKYTAYPDRNATVTIMVYMCGTDLETEYGMASSDLKEMMNADISDNVNIIVQTGGTKKWKTSKISNSKNQIYKVTSGGMTLLAESKKASMVDPDTLTGFIDYCTENYEADRYMLIFWDHGGGSVSGYGYDQHYSGDSMTLDEIDSALRESGCKFDFIGFDACLMATLETAIVAERYADYLIASEETEPGVGWYYTTWLNELSDDTSISTVELGKSIIDSFVKKCASDAPGSKTTLSIVDLAELSGTVPEAFSDFAESTAKLISKKNYQQVSDARSAVREFSSNINQVDLVDLAQRIGTDESEELAEALKGCIKYNRTSGNVSNAYGISIFFPYGSSRQMSSALKTYDKIGLDDAYGKCIKEFASVTAGGQIANGGGASLLDSIFGSYTGSSSPSTSSSGSLLDVIGALGGTSSSSSGSNADMLGTMFDLFLGSSSSKEITGIDVGQDEDWFDAEKVAGYEGYISDNYLDPDRIVITENENGQKVVSLTAEEWDLVQTIELNVFYDDDEGYIDLGMDSIFERDEETGDLYIDYDGMWVSLNGQVASYYMLSEERSEDGEEYVITGYIPALLNGSQIQIIVVFDSGIDGGVVTGYRPVYEDNTAPSAKIITEFRGGDRIDLICDYYSYDQEYTDSYVFGEPIIIDGELRVEDVELILDEGSVLYSYCLTDIYGNMMWTAQTEF